MLLNLRSRALSDLCEAFGDMIRAWMSLKGNFNVSRQNGIKFRNEKNFSIFFDRIMYTATVLH